MRSHWLTILALSLVTAGCGEEEKPDPTSAAALRRAPSVESGCRYVKTTSSSYGTASDVKSTSECSEYKTCDELEAPEDYWAAGGGSYFQSSTTYSDAVDFLGTCDDPQPISCEGRGGADACEECVINSDCASLVLCESDPNCIAIVDCIEHCGEDQACASRCVQNGEYKAKNHLARLARAVKGCSADCE